MKRFHDLVPLEAVFYPSGHIIISEQCSLSTTNMHCHKNAAVALHATRPSCVLVVQFTLYTLVHVREVVPDKVGYFFGKLPKGRIGKQINLVKFLF